MQVTVSNRPSRAVTGVLFVILVFLGCAGFGTAAEGYWDPVWAGQLMGGLFMAVAALIVYIHICRRRLSEATFLLAQIAHSSEIDAIALERLKVLKKEMEQAIDVSCATFKKEDTHNMLGDDAERKRNLYFLLNRLLEKHEVLKED